MFWKDWAGYYAVRSFDTYPEREYYAVRHAAGLIDVTPLYKYDVRGPDAGEFLSRIMVRDVAGRFPVGRVAYLCWCDDAGKVMDDGTVSRLEGDAYRVTAAEPALSWLMEHAGPYDVTIEDTSRLLAALALQGPRSRDILRSASGVDLDGLRFFRLTRGTIGKAEVVVSRTGYTGDLGYEIWVHRDRALDVWDAVMEAGRPYRILPVGLDAVDVLRVEAGFIMNGVDYFSAHHVLLPSRKSSPFETGLGWTVQIDREPFIGQAALREEFARGPVWSFVGLEYDWDQFETLFTEVGLPPQVPTAAWRQAVPLYDGRGRQIGQATSGAWSPTLKKNLALATVLTPFSEPGTQVKIEVTVEYRRRTVAAYVRKTPFFDPERKRAAG